MNGYQSFYIRPCLEFDGGTKSYACHNQFYADLTGLQERKNNNPEFEYSQFWTVYGTHDEGISQAISDLDSEKSANDMMEKLIYHTAPKPDAFKEIVGDEDLINLIIKHIRSWGHETYEMQEGDADRTPFYQCVRDNSKSFLHKLVEAIKIEIH